MADGSHSGSLNGSQKAASDDQIEAIQAASWNGLHCENTICLPSASTTCKHTIAHIAHVENIDLCIEELIDL